MLRQKIDRHRRALEDGNDDGNKADKGRTVAAENGGRETEKSRARAGSLNCTLLGIRLPLRPSHLR